MALNYNSWGGGRSSKFTSIWIRKEDKKISKLKANNIPANTADNTSSNTKPDSIGAYFKSKVDGVVNDDVENTPKKKMKRAKKDIASPI